MWIERSIDKEYMEKGFSQRKARQIQGQVLARQMLQLSSLPNCWVCPEPSDEAVRLNSTS